MTEPMTQLDAIENETSLNQLRCEWTQLAASATPMQSPEWMLAWWDAHRTPQDRLSVLTVRGGNGELLGLVPWYRRTTVTLGSTLRFLGSGRACSDYQTLLCQSGAEDTVVRHVAEWLSGRRTAANAKAASAAPAWDLLDLDGVSADDRVMNHFVETLADRGHITHCRPTESTWRIDLSGGWQGFLSRQSKTQRSQTRNLVNRFDKSDDLQMRFASEEPAHVGALVCSLIELHQLRWRAAGVAGCFSEVRMKSFFEKAMCEMIASGLADVVVLERNRRAVAAQAWLTQNGSVFVYQSGRDPAEDAHRVGRIANLVALRWACDHGYQAIDYLRGDEGYKSRMRAEPTASHRVRIVARANFPELRHRLWLACRQVKIRWQELRRPTVDQSSAAEAAEETNAATIHSATSNSATSSLATLNSATSK